MIELTKMNHEKFYLNPNLIEMVETTPDTLISMMSGKKYYVLESVDTVREKFLEYYKSVHARGKIKIS
jgi:flagellar protein FlbD